MSVPLKPIDTVPPLAAIAEFQLALVTVTAWPLWVQVPSQPPLDSPHRTAGKLNVSVHGLMAVNRSLVNVIVAPNPPGQLLVTA